MHPQSDFDADLSRLRQMERPDHVSGLLNSIHVTDTSVKIRLGSRFVGSAECTIAAILAIAGRGGRFVSELASARKAHLHAATANCRWNRQFHEEPVIRVRTAQVAPTVPGKAVASHARVQ